MKCCKKKPKNTSSSADSNVMSHHRPRMMVGIKNLINNKESNFKFLLGSCSLTSIFHITAKCTTKGIRPSLWM